MKQSSALRTNGYVNYSPHDLQTRCENLPAADGLQIMWRIINVLLCS